MLLQPGLFPELQNFISNHLEEISVWVYIKCVKFSIIKIKLLLVSSQNLLCLRSSPPLKKQFHSFQCPGKQFWSYPLLFSSLNSHCPSISKTYGCTLIGQSPSSHWWGLSWAVPHCLADLPSCNLACSHPAPATSAVSLHLRCGRCVLKSHVLHVLFLQLFP